MVLEEVQEGSPRRRPIQIDIGSAGCGVLTNGKVIVDAIRWFFGRELEETLDMC